MKATDILKHEHQVILKVLDAAEREARNIRAPGKIDAERTNKIVDFIRNFADRCHHAKEEDQLFVRMRDRGFPFEGGPIAVMLMEHEEGRRHVRAVADAVSAAASGDEAAVAKIADHLQAYVELLRQHIDKEDNILYPMADQILTPQDQEELIKTFERIEAEDMGEGVHEKYHQLAHELSEHA